MIDIIELFHTDKSLTRLQKELNIDQRKIRKVWVKEFGKEAVSQRGKKIVSNAMLNRRLVDVDKIYKLAKQGYCTVEIANILNVKVRLIQKYIGNLAFESNRKRKIGLISKRRCLSKDKRREILSYFDSKLFPHEIAKICNVCMNTVINVFKSHDKVAYIKRKELLRPIAIGKIFKSLEKAGRLGSKNEIAFYNSLSSVLNCNMVHHDYAIFPPFEIDITIPELKIAICWDGIGHFKPIFGEKIFKQVVYRDRLKRKHLAEIGWKVYTVQDLTNGLSEKFINLQTNEFVKYMISNGYEKYLR